MFFRFFPRNPSKLTAIRGSASVQRLLHIPKSQQHTRESYFLKMLARQIAEKRREDLESSNESPLLQEAEIRKTWGADAFSSGCVPHHVYK